MDGDETIRAHPGPAMSGDARPPALEGLRVLDTTTGIAGPYCTKVLADAGADVVKVEDPAGDPLRSQHGGGLFEYLHASKRSVTGGLDQLVAGAEILVVDAPPDTERLWREHPSLVVVSITPYGCSGPWFGRPWTEFTLQAACGSTGSRGLPDRPPITGGGRTGEWLAGTYAALGALAAWRSAGLTGHGDHVDVAILDCMAVTMTTYPSLFSSFAGWPPMRGTGRSVEVPSIEPSRDGYFVVTTNSAQQFHDFLVMIERSDLCDDRELALVVKRFARREEFLAAVHEHTTKRTTAELLEEAANFRLPAGPVLHGGTVTSFEQFVALGTFVGAPSGRFVQPRVPFKISDAPPRPFGPAPSVGEHDGLVEWPPVGGAAPDSARRLPLEGVRIIDCTAWWAGPAATQVLASLGADVVKVESTRRPDLMRMASTKPPSVDQWWEWGALFHGANTNKRGVTLDLTRPEGVAVFERLVGTADALVENYTPRVMEQFGLGWERLHELNPELLMVRMPAFGLDGPWRDRTGFAQTMECLTGMAWLTGFADGPPVLLRGACDPLAGMHAAIATLVALVDRERHGGGRLVETIMVEAALNAAVEQIIEFGLTGTVLSRDGNRGREAAPQGLYACAGDDEWLAVSVPDDATWSVLVEVLGHPAWADRPELGTEAGRRAAHDEIDAGLGAWSSARPAEDQAEELSRAGVPAAVVIAARDMVHNPQLLHRRLFETEDHPVTGPHEIPIMPFRLRGVPTWLRRTSPTLGEHNDEVLGELGLDQEEIVRLVAEGVVGDRLVSG
ncbi:MAG TPA: CoA transferase [Acidimicrobiales bacterium]|nr:CoA transferase [Acidimicrobiales bacterium]